VKTPQTEYKDKGVIMIKSEITNSGSRIADDDIYLNEDRSENPKEIFKYVASKIEKINLRSGSTLLDVGCATGEFIFYLMKKFPGLKFTGIDVSEAMINRASEKMPKVNYFCKDILTETHNPNQKYNVVTCMGAIQIFDEIESSLKNLLMHAKKNGYVYIVGIFNEYPVDVIMRYRRTNLKNSIWETGWNLFCKETYENTLKSLDYDMVWEWYDFRMPFSLNKQIDPMRSWTIKTGFNSHQLVNGASQLINLKVLEIKLK